MTDTPNPALLPAGLRDVLPPDAAYAADLVHRLRGIFGLYGYDWVEPPLVEFEDSLLDGAGAAMAPDTFRLMDPVSQRMMGVRADITVQVARVATTRLAHLPRPLRLAYAGDVLRVKGKQLRPERQFTQIGAELIGAAEAAADVEAVSLAVDALMQIGVTRLSVDLTVPTLVPLVLAAQDFASGTKRPAATQRLRNALDRKDAAAVDAAVQMLGREGKIFGDILRANGPVEPALAALAALDLPNAARREIERLAAVARELAAAWPEVSFTIDATENRGLEYHIGVCFTIFRAGVRGELGLGGRYRAGRLDEARPQEHATGFTLYLDPILRALPAAAAPERVYLPFGTERAIAARLRADGHAVIAALAPEPNGDAAAEAHRLGCKSMWRADAIERLA